MLDKFVDVVYCKECKMILIKWKQDIAEYHEYEQFFAEDGMIENGESEFIDSEPVKDAAPICIECRENAPYTTPIPKEIFVRILKGCYANSKYPAHGVKIELKPSTVKHKMIAPTLQEVKEALLEELI